jgi:hypothetical protein
MSGSPVQRSWQADLSSQKLRPNRIRGFDLPGSAAPGSRGSGADTDVSRRFVWFVRVFCRVLGRLARFCVTAPWRNAGREDQPMARVIAYATAKAWEPLPILDPGSLSASRPAGRRRPSSAAIIPAPRPSGPIPGRGLYTTPNSTPVAIRRVSSRLAVISSPAWHLSFAWQSCT